MNMMNTHWENKKDEIENTIADFKPDVFIISEANFFDDIPEYMTNIGGYQLVHSPTFKFHKYDRLVVLIEDNLKVKIRQDLMDDSNVASIWMDLTRRGVRKITLGCTYREHKLLLQPEGHTSGTERDQNSRWRAFIKQWTTASQGGGVTQLY